MPAGFCTAAASCRGAGAAVEAGAVTETATEIMIDEEDAAEAAAVAEAKKGGGTDMSVGIDEIGIGIDIPKTATEAQNVGSVVSGTTGSAGATMTEKTRNAAGGPRVVL